MPPPPGSVMSSSSGCRSAHAFDSRQIVCLSLCFPGLCGGQRRHVRVPCASLDAALPAARASSARNHRVPCNGLLWPDLCARLFRRGLYLQVRACMRMRTRVCEEAACAKCGLDVLEPTFSIKTIRIQFVLFGMQKGTFCPCSAGWGTSSSYLACRRGHFVLVRQAGDHPRPGATPEGPYSSNDSPPGKKCAACNWDVRQMRALGV
jgi:hypothetical protein